MIEPLDWYIDCEKSEERIGLLVLSILHTFPCGQGKKIAKNICFKILPDKVLGCNFYTRSRPMAIVLIKLEEKEEKKAIEIIAHEIAHYLCGHYKLPKGSSEEIQRIEDEADEKKEEILTRYYPEIERLLKEEGATTLKELFSKVYPEDIKSLY